MKKYSIGIIGDWAKKNGGDCLSSEYEGPHTALKWQCRKGHTWLAIPNSIRRGTWCPTCRGRNPRIEDMGAIASERGGKLIASHIPDSSTKIEWECTDGHRWFASPTDIKRGRWCPKCKAEQVSARFKGCLQDMQALGQARGGRCLSQVYQDSQHKLLWQCQKGHQWQAIPQGITRGQWCPQCEGSLPRSLEDAWEVARDRGGKCLSTSYINNNTPMLWQCELGHQWEASFNNIKDNGTWCPECSDGISERLCRAILEYKLGVPFSKARPNWLVNERGNRMEFDGYSETSQIAFEFHGRQHFEMNTRMTPTKIALLQRIGDDESRRVICAQRGIKLIEIAQIGSKLPTAKVIEAAARKANVSFDLSDDEYENILFTVRSPKLLDLARTLAKLRGGKCLSSSVPSVKIKIKWKCQCGYVWEAPLDRIKIGGWCPRCAGNVASTLEEYHAIAISRGGQCLSAKYVNADSKLRWRCSHGHEWDARAISVKRGDWCKRCWASKNADKTRLSIQVMQETARRRGGECLSDHYVDANTKLAWKCALGHVWSAKPGEIRFGTWCPQCAKAKHSVVAQNGGQVLQSNISRRVAGSWFSWFIWSVGFLWFVWFRERNKLDKPATPPLNRHRLHLL